MDFSNMALGETVEVTVAIMQTVPEDASPSQEKEWWRFEVDAEPEVATTWLLLPEGDAHADFRVVRWKNDAPEVIELVEPTHETRMQSEAVYNWSVVHPEPGHTYSSRWK